MYLLQNFNQHTDKSADPMLTNGAKPTCQMQRDKDLNTFSSLAKRQVWILWNLFQDTSVKQHAYYVSGLKKNYWLT